MFSLILYLSFVSSALTANLPSRQLSFQQRNLDTITKIYKRTVYPTNLDFLANGPASVPQGLFNENATGRITPLGNFTGFNDSTEYFFALAPVASPPSYVGFADARVVSFQSQCASFASSIVYFTGRVFHPNASNDGEFVSTLKQVWSAERIACYKYRVFHATAGISTFNLVNSKGDCC